MLTISYTNKVLLVVLTVLLLMFTIGIVVSIKFLKKQAKKYRDCLRLIKEKENGILNEEYGVNDKEIKKIEKVSDINKLKETLYKTYLKFVDKLVANDKNFKNILYDFISKYYENKISIYIEKNKKEIIQDIELKKSSILEYKKKELKFKINITCINYIVMDDNVISGSKNTRVEQIFILTYVKNKQKWLINNIENVYTENLSE